MSPDPFREYLDALDAALDGLPARERQDVVREVRSHLEASLASLAGPLEARAQEAIARFGGVDEVAAPLRAAHAMAHGATGFRPVGLARGVLASVASGGAWAIFGVLVGFGYLLVLAAALVGAWDFLQPATGLWLHPDGSWSLTLHGFEGSRELMGPWLGPAAIMLALVGWWGMNRLVRWSVRRLPGAGLP